MSRQESTQVEDNAKRTVQFVVHLSPPRNRCFISGGGGGSNLEESGEVRSSPLKDPKPLYLHPQSLQFPPLFIYLFVCCIYLLFAGASSCRPFLPPLPPLLACNCCSYTRRRLLLLSLSLGAAISTHTLSLSILGAAISTHSLFPSHLRGRRFYSLSFSRLPPHSSENSGTLFYIPYCI